MRATKIQTVTACGNHRSYSRGATMKRAPDGLDQSRSCSIHADSDVPVQRGPADSNRHSRPRRAWPETAVQTLIEGRCFLRSYRKPGTGRRFPFGVSAGRPHGMKEIGSHCPVCRAFDSLGAPILASIWSVASAPLAQLAEQRTLNPRVRGSSPWRRTRFDLGFYDSRSFFMCPFCPHVCSVFARVHGPCNPGLVKNGPSGTGYGGTRHRIRAASPGRRRTASALPPARVH